MRYLLIVKLISFLIIFPFTINSTSSKNLDNTFSNTKLEESLNLRRIDLIKDMFLENSFNKLNKNFLDFTKNYKNAKWSITVINNFPNRKILDVKITSTRKIGGHIYDLNCRQKVEVKIYKNKIKSFKVINEQSILKSQETPLIVKVSAPDTVLTGERYEMNLIVEKPLDDSLMASGIVALEKKDGIYLSQDYFGIKPNLSGGLFKYIQAPIEPGFQTISAIITHPKGIYSLTKKIQVGL